jgi:hypothetical protein
MWINSSSKRWRTFQRATTFANFDVKKGFGRMEAFVIFKIAEAIRFY